MSTDTKGVVNTVYTQLNTGAHPIALQVFGAPVRLVFQDTQPDVDHSTYHLLGPKDGLFNLAENTTNVWARSATALGTSVIVTESPKILTSIDSTQENSKYGKVYLIDAADSAVTIWSFADDNLSVKGTTKTFPTSATTLYLCSSSTSDTSKTFEVEVINGSGVRSYVQVVSNGQTSVAFATSAGMDVNGIKLIGDTQSNVGQIFVTNVDSFSSGVPTDVNSVLAHISVGYGISHACTYYVPSGYKIRIKKILLGFVSDPILNTTATGVVQLRVKEDGKSWLTVREYKIQNGFTAIEEHGLVFDTKTRIELRLADTNGSDVDTIGKFDFDLIGV